MKTKRALRACRVLHAATARPTSCPRRRPQSVGIPATNAAFRPAGLRNGDGHRIAEPNAPDCPILPEFAKKSPRLVTIRSRAYQTLRLRETLLPNPKAAGLAPLTSGHATFENPQSGDFQLRSAEWNRNKYVPIGHGHASETTPIADESLSVSNVHCRNQRYSRNRRANWLVRQ
jgi:hypothetical protein